MGSRYLGEKERESVRESTNASSCPTPRFPTLCILLFSRPLALSPSPSLLSLAHPNAVHVCVCLARRPPVAMTAKRSNTSSCTLISEPEFQELPPCIQYVNPFAFHPMPSAFTLALAHVLFGFGRDGVVDVGFDCFCVPRPPVFISVYHYQHYCCYCCTVGAFVGAATGAMDTSNRKLHPAVGERRTLHLWRIPI